MINKIFSMKDSLFSKISNPDLGIFLVRLSLSLTFIHAGYLKLTNMSNVIAGFSQMGMPPILAYLVAVSEFAGGLFMLFGIYSRYAAVALSIIMIVAMFKVHMPNGYGLANGGFEYVLNLLLLSISVLVTENDKYSICTWWNNRSKSNQGKLDLSK